MMISFFVAISLIFSRSITSGIQKLFVATHQVADGNFDVQVEVSGNDEVGALSRAFSQMAKRIQSLLEVSKQKAVLDNEIKTAQLVQNSFFPPSVVKNDHFELTSFYEPANLCGGDWWNYYHQDGQLLLLIGDATGHGVSSALITASAYSSFVTLQACMNLSEISPSQVAEYMNDSIFQSSEGKVVMTFFILKMNLVTREIHYCNASHIMPIVLGRDSQSHRGSEVDFLESQPTAPLGERKSLAFESKKDHLKTGERIIMYTDGFIEARDPEGREYGEGRFVRNLVKLSGCSSEHYVDLLTRDLKHFTQGKKHEDDITLLVADVH